VRRGAHEAKARRVVVTDQRAGDGSAVGGTDLHGFRFDDQIAHGEHGLVVDDDAAAAAHAAQRIDGAATFGDAGFDLHD
jgi:hypothetical protein